MMIDQGQFLMLDFKYGPDFLLLFDLFQLMILLFTLFEGVLG